MKNYLKLVDFEMKRFWKMYAVLIGITMIVECLLLAYIINGIVLDVNGEIQEDIVISFAQVTSRSFLFFVPISLCVTVLFIYVFFTWYREWFGKNTFAVQLLMLPFNRLTVFFAKLSSLLIFIFMSISVQIMIFPILLGIYKALLPAGVTEGTNVIAWLGSNSILVTLIPGNIADFIVSYGIGITAVVVIFTIIMIERSFRLKGIGMAILYGAICIVLLRMSSFISSVVPLYKNEVLMIDITTWAAILILSLGISHYLINKKIWV